MASWFWREASLFSRGAWLALTILATSVGAAVWSRDTTADRLAFMFGSLVIVSVLLLVPAALLVGLVRRWGLYAIGLVSLPASLALAFAEADRLSETSSTGGIALLDAPFIGAIVVTGLALVQVVGERWSREPRP